MQYLLKITIDNTSVSRLISLDGKADRAVAGNLIVKAFDFVDGNCAFTFDGKTFSGGRSGSALSTEDLNSFDEFNFKEGDTFNFTVSSNEKLTLTCVVMKAEERLFCLIPSCLVGSASLPFKEDLTVEAINKYFDSEDLVSLDLREVTARLRALGTCRKDINQSMVEAGAVPLNFKVE